MLRSRPITLAGPENFELRRCPVPDLEGGQALVRIEMAALSAWQGMRTKDFRNFIRPFDIGELISCDTFARLVESRCADLPVGTAVVGRQGWQDYAAVRPARAWSGSPAARKNRLRARPAGRRYRARLPLRQICRRPCRGLSGRREPVFDTVGGPIADAVSERLAKRADILLIGRVAANNSAAPEQNMANVRHVWSQEATIYSFNRYADKELYPQVIERLGALLRAGSLKMHNHIVDGMEETPAALHNVLSGNHTGKMPVRYSDRDGNRI